MKDNSYVADVRGIGFLYSIEFVRDKETLEQFPLDDNVTFKVMEATVSRGVVA